MVFDFALMHVPWSRRGVRGGDRSKPSGRSRRPAYWPCWVLSNHDQPRHRSRFGGLGGARSRGGAPAPHAARDAVSLRGRGARPARCRRSRRSARRSRRSRRVACADSVGRARRARLAATVAALAAEPSSERRDEAPIRTRSWRSTGGCSRSGGARRRSSSGAGACSTRPPARSSTSGRGTATFAASPSTSRDRRVRGCRRRRRLAASRSRPGAERDGRPLGRIARAGRGGHPLDVTPPR